MELWRDPLGLFDRALGYSEEVLEYRFGPFPYFLAHSPEAAEHVLVKAQRNYRKSKNYESLRLVLGNGLVTSEGDLWRRQRKLAQPAFHHRSLQSFVEVMSSCAREAIEGWPGSIDVHQRMTQLTFRIVGLTLFSTDLSKDAGAMGKDMETLLSFASAYAEKVIKLPTWVPTPANRRFVAALGRVDRMIYRIVEERRQGPQQPDLLGMLMAATEEGSEARMSPRQLRDELITLASAGHETTTNALTWTLFLLSKHPEVEAKLIEEVDRVLGEAPPSLSSLAQLQYTEQVIKESMRLYPPAWVIEREAILEDVICGYRIPKDTIVMVSPYVMHRRPELWEAPERFWPERFSPEREAERPRGAFLPFGAGPRVCIGNAFAMMEAKIIIAMILQRVRLALPAECKASPEAGVTMRARLNRWAQVQPRGPRLRAA